jgi:hypothetical protein
VVVRTYWDVLSLLAMWLPIRWGQAPSPVWLGVVAWVRRLHTVEEGTPDLGYRHCPLSPLSILYIL